MPPKLLKPPYAVRPQLIETSGRPSAFISHCGIKPSLLAVKEFLQALQIEPVVVEEQASEGREVLTNVDEHAANCHLAVVIYTKDIQTADGNWQPSGSVLVEAGMLRQMYPGRVIYLLEEGSNLGTLAGAPVYGTFTEDNMAPAYRKIVCELVTMGFLKTLIPPDLIGLARKASSAEKGHLVASVKLSWG